MPQQQITQLNAPAAPQGIATQGLPGRPPAAAGGLRQALWILVAMLVLKSHLALQTLLAQTMS